MFRRFVLIVTSLLTMLFVGLWIERSLRTVSLDELERRAKHCEREFDRLDIELYRAIRAESSPAEYPGPHRPKSEINADLNRARAALDDAYIKHADAFKANRVTGAKRFGYPLQWDLSRFEERWCFIQVSADLINFTFSSADAVPIRANWTPEQEAHAAYVGQMDNAFRSTPQTSLSPPPLQGAAPDWPPDLVARLRSKERLESAERLRELLQQEGLFFSYNAEPTREVILQVPLWMLILLFGVFPTYALIARRVREHIRIERGQCLKCGYNLTGNTSGVCPECGTAIASRKRAPNAALT
jgi:hypothetical protein